MGTRRRMFTAVAGTAAVLPAGSANAFPRPLHAAPPAPSVRAVHSKHQPPRARARARRVLARSAADLFWINARGDCYNDGIVVDPSSQTFGTRNNETAYYRAMLWNRSAWAYAPWIEFKRTLYGDGAVVNGNYVNSLPAQTFLVGRRQYQRAAIQVYVASRGGYDWNWVTTVPRAFSLAQSSGPYCYFP